MRPTGSRPFSVRHNPARDRVLGLPLWVGPLMVEETRDGVSVRGRAFAEYLKAGEHPLRPYVASGVGVGGRPGG